MGKINLAVEMETVRNEICNSLEDVPILRVEIILTERGGRKVENRQGDLAYEGEVAKKGVT